MVYLGKAKGDNRPGKNFWGGVTNFSESSVFLHDLQNVEDFPA